MANFEKRKNGWRAQVEKKGIRKSKVLPTKQEAINWAAAIEAEIVAGASGKYPKKTLAEAIERYRVEVTNPKAKTKPRAARADNLRFNALLRDYPQLCEKLLTEIGPEDIALWKNSRLEKVSESSVLREAQQIRPIWTLARKEWRWVGNSPWPDVKLPPKGHARTKLTTWREVRKLVRSVGYRADMAPRNAKQQTMWVYMVALHTALRSGEVLRMSRSTVDLKKRIYKLGSHKTEEHVGARVVPLPRRVAKLLKVLDADAAAHGRDDYFSISDQSRDVHWRTVRDRLMIEGLNFHDSRAAALTWLSKRLDVMTLAKISGHVDIQQLFDAYYREAPEDIARRI